MIPVTKTPVTEPPPAPAKTSAPTPHIAVIGRNMVIIGKVQSSEDLYVDGEVRGTLELENCRLTIGPNAHVAANVSAKDVILLGQLSGNVSATGRVELRDGCDLVGDISAARLVIQESAVFRGKVEPLHAEASSAKGAEIPVSTSPAKH